MEYMITESVVDIIEGYLNDLEFCEEEYVMKDNDVIRKAYNIKLQIVDVGTRYGSNNAYALLE